MPTISMSSDLTNEHLLIVDSLLSTTVLETVNHQDTHTVTKRRNKMKMDEQWKDKGNNYYISLHLHATILTFFQRRSLKI